MAGRVLDYLETLARDGARPSDAKDRLLKLQHECFPTELRLIWEEEPGDRSVHYDVLLRPPGACTFLLSMAPDRALPWPLRGARRWSETELLRVNATVLDVQQAVACLDFVWSEAPVATRMIDVCLIQEELDSHPVALDDHEIQEGLDAFRRARGLLDADETRHWMQQRGVTHAQLERLAIDNLKIARLRQRVTRAGIEPYFAAHREELETVQIAQILFAEESAARAACRQIRGGDVDFLAAAAAALAAGETVVGSQAEVLVQLRIEQVPNALRERVFAAAPGELIGPDRVGSGYALVRVLSRSPARLDRETRAAIEQILFEEWLRARRHAAVVSWNWGGVTS